MIRLLALVTDAYGGKGGIAQYNRDLFSALAVSPQLEAALILPRAGSCDDALPAKLTQLRPVFGRINYIFRALLQARRFRPTVVFCGHIYLLPLAWLLCRVLRVKLWLQIHGVEAWTRPRWIARCLLSDLDLCIAVSRYTRQQFLRWANTDPARTKVLPNTYSEEFKPRDRERVRRDRGLADKVVLLTFGRLSEREQYKGHDRIIDCLPSLVHGIPNLLYLVGGDGADRRRLQQLSETRGVADRVCFLGAVADSERVDLYVCADLFVMPSTGEGFGIVFLEAMACGTPALGLDCDGSRDPLLDGQLGYVTHIEQLSDRIKSALGESRSSSLSRDVQHLFGRQIFSQRAEQLLKHGTEDRLGEGSRQL